MEATTPAVATAFRLIGIGSCDAVAAMRERVDATSVEGLMLAADAAWCRGEPCAAECALRAAHASAAARDRPYVVDALAWLLAVCGRYARAAALLDAPSADRTLEAGRLALRALVHAAHGDAARSLREAAAARDELRSVPDETARVRVAVRLAHAAYVRRDAADALAAVETGLRAARSAAAPRAAASMHAVAYAVHLRLRGDAGGAWRHAVELERTAELACDATLRRLANAALCELAAERGDVHRAQLACAAAGHVRSGRTGFGPALGSVLGAARDGDLAGARACAAELDGSVARTPGERAMARALVALRRPGRCATGEPPRDLDVRASGPPASRRRRAPAPPRARARVGRGRARRRRRARAPRRIRTLRSRRRRRGGPVGSSRDARRVSRRGPRLRRTRLRRTALRAGAASVRPAHAR
jgi:hypothetical protein